MMFDPPEPTMVVAVGERPDWHIERRGGTLVLRRAGQPPVVANGVVTRLTPLGTRMAARSHDGYALTVAIVFGECRLTGTNRRTSYIAMVAYRDLRLHGCFIGPVPGERPLLD